MHAHFLVLLLPLIAKLVDCEIFTALAELEELLDTEAVLINTLESYIKAEEQKIDLLKRYAATEVVLAKLLMLC